MLLLSSMEQVIDEELIEPLVKLGHVRNQTFSAHSFRCASGLGFFGATLIEQLEEGGRVELFIVHAGVYHGDVHAHGVRLVILKAVKRKKILFPAWQQLAIHGEQPGVGTLDMVPQPQFPLG